MRYSLEISLLVDLLTLDTLCNGASFCRGAAAAKAEARKTKDYKSKVDGIQTQLIAAAFELDGNGVTALFYSLSSKTTKTTSAQYISRNLLGFY